MSARCEEAPKTGHEEGRYNRPFNERDDLPLQPSAFLCWGRPRMTNRLKMAEITTIAKLLGSAHAVVLGDLPILKRFQVHPNGKSR